MGGTGVPTAVRRLIADRIESFQQLEILLLLRAASDKEWSPRDVARALVTEVDSSEDSLERMTRARLLISNGDSYRYAPATVENGSCGRRRGGELREVPGRRDRPDLLEAKRAR